MDRCLLCVLAMEVLDLLAFGLLAVLGGQVLEPFCNGDRGLRPIGVGVGEVASPPYPLHDGRVEDSLGLLLGVELRDLLV